MLFGKELEESIKRSVERLNASIESRYERIEQGWTDMDDCFLSHAVEERAIREHNTQLEILKGNGTMEIEAIYDSEGNEVNARWVETKYGAKLVANGIFANSRKALLKKTGWTTKTITVPCWTKFVAGSGGGLCAVYSGSYEVVRWHTNMVTGEHVGYPE